MSNNELISKLEIGHWPPPVQPRWDPYNNPNQTTEGYAVSGKIMMSAIVVLFFVVVLVICLHLYARWYLLRARRRQLLVRRRRAASSRLVFHHTDNAASTAATQGLDYAVLMTLPVFVYSEKTHPDPIECAVCLSEFEENETGRVLPKCNHSFHVECIDMWFHSHSTCPLCRSLVESVPQKPDPTHGDLPKPESSSSSSTATSAASSSAPLRKPFEVTIDIPARSGSFNDGVGESPASQFRSPVMTRVLSFLSRERRPASPSPCGGCGGSASAVVAGELDVERGRDELSQLGSESNRY